METIEILLIILIDVIGFLTGLALGRLVKVKKQEDRRRAAVRKNSDWQALLNYTPGEPTEKSAVKFINTKENKYGRKNRNHTR